jgi:hypothetical protein
MNEPIAITPEMLKLLLFQAYKMGVAQTVNQKPNMQKVWDLLPKVLTV